MFLGQIKKLSKNDEEKLNKLARLINNVEDIYWYEISYKWHPREYIIVPKTYCLICYRIFDDRFEHGLKHIKEHKL